MSTIRLLSDIDPDEVSVVKRGANRRRFALLKARDEISGELADLLSVPADGEGAVLDLLRKHDADEATEEAAVAFVRLAKAFEENVPDEVLKAMATVNPVFSVAAQKPMPAGDTAAGASRDGGASGAPRDGDADGDEDLDGDGKGGDKDGDGDGDDVSKRDFDRGVGGGVDRDKLPASDFAGPNRTYPIVNQSDVSDALRLAGKAANPGAVRSRIAAIARRKGLKVPDSISKESGDTTTNEGGSDMTDVVAPVRKEDGSWDLSGVAPELREFYGEVLKSQTDAAEREKALVERVEKAEAKASGAEEKLREREFVAKAADYEHIAKADELGPVLKAIADAVDEDTLGKLEGFLKQADERIKQGDLFRQSNYVVTDATTGKVVKSAEAAGGDAWAKIEELAQGLVEKSTDLTHEQAVAKALETPDGKALYADYMAESGVR